MTKDIKGSNELLTNEKLREQLIGNDTTSSGLLRSII